MLSRFTYPKIDVMVILIAAIAWIKSPVKLPFYFAGLSPAVASFIGSVLDIRATLSSTTDLTWAVKVLNAPKAYVRLAILVLSEAAVGGLSFGLVYAGVGSHSVYLRLVAWMTACAVASTLIWVNLVVVFMRQSENRRRRRRH